MPHKAQFDRHGFITRGGTLEARRVTVLCDADTVKGIAADSKDLIRAIGIQMVYIPEGAFSLGAGGTEVGSFHQYTDGVDRSKPYRVTGSGPILTGKKQGQLWAGNHGGPLADGGEIPASYPNGYAAFYCMKHHISPAQYADFLNALDTKIADEGLRTLSDAGAAVLRTNEKIKLPGK